MENVLAMLADEAMLLHVKDVARILTVSTSCAYALIRSGQIKLPNSLQRTARFG